MLKSDLTSVGTTSRDQGSVGKTVRLLFEDPALVPTSRSNETRSGVDHLLLKRVFENGRPYQVPR